MDEEGSSGGGALEEPSVADALVSSYGWVEPGGGPPADDPPPTTRESQTPATMIGAEPPAAASPGAGEDTVPPFAPPPRPDVPATVAPEPPAAPRPVRGVPRRPWLAALLNASGLGAGYAYLHRWVRWGVYLALLAAIGVLAWWSDGAGEPALWLGSAGALVVASVIDAWLAARTSVRRAHAVAPGRPAVALAVAVVLLAVVAGGALAYRAAGDSAYRLGVSAMAKGDCAAAIDRFRSVTTVYELTFSSDVARADAAIEECRAFQAAEGVADGGTLEGAVAAFRAIEEANPGSALVPVARDREAATYVAWAAELVAAGRFQEAIDRLETVDRELAESEPAGEAHEAEAAAYVAWGDALAAGGEFEEAVAKYDVADEEFEGTAGADAAHTAAGVTYVAWAKRLLSNQQYAEGIERYSSAAQDYADTPASEEAQTALDELLQSSIDDVDTVRACISRRTLDAFVEAEVDAKRARNNLAPALYHCGLTQMDVVNYDLALAEFDRLLDDFPNSQFVDETRTSVIDARVAKYHQESSQDFGGPPQRIASAPSGTAVFEFQNDSPVRQELLFSGPSSTSIVLEPCASCVRYEDGQEPFYCPQEGPTQTVTLTPGDYSIAVVGPDEAFLEASVDSWTLTSGSKYYACVMVVIASG